MRSSILFLAAALACALIGCGGDEEDGVRVTPCEAACRHGEACGYTAEETAECLQSCADMPAPDSFYRCLSGLSCEEVLDEEAPLERCGDELIGAVCVQVCGSLEACDPEDWTDKERRDCNMGCGMVFTPDAQRCLAEAEGCEEVAACME